MMKTSEFYCKLHHSSTPIVTTISCHIDSWEQYICYECDLIKKDADKIESWLRDTNSSLNNSIKEKIKTNQLVYYNGNVFCDPYDYEREILSQELTKYTYYDGNILTQHLYQCGFLTKRKQTLDWRLSYQTMRSCYTIELDYHDDDVPYLFLDDAALIKANYKRKHSDG